VITVEFHLIEGGVLELR